MLLVVATILGCGDPYDDLAPGREGGKRRYWTMGGAQYTNPSIQWFLNSYGTDERYADYGIVYYDAGPKPRSYAERDLFLDSLRLCRQSFGDAYAANEIRTLSSTVQDVPFKPRFVAVVIPFGDASEESVGAIFEADQLFNPAVDLVSLLNSADISRGEVWSSVEDEKNGTRRSVYPFIEDHMAKLDE